MVSAISSGWSAFSENRSPLCNGHTNRNFPANGKHPWLDNCTLPDNHLVQSYPHNHISTTSRCMYVQAVTYWNNLPSCFLKHYPVSRGLLGDFYSQDLLQKNASGLIHQSCITVVILRQNSSVLGPVAAGTSLIY